jgi:hypothetical protein
VSDAKVDSCREGGRRAEVAAKGFKGDLSLGASLVKASVSGTFSEALLFVLLLLLLLATVLLLLLFLSPLLLLLLLRLSSPLNLLNDSLSLKVLIVLLLVLVGLTAELRSAATLAVVALTAALKAPAAVVEVVAVLSMAESEGIVVPAPVEQAASVVV